WDAVMGKPLLVLNVVSGKSKAVYNVAFSPDGKRLVTSSEDGGGVVWDAVSGARLMTLPSEEGLNCATFSPDGTRIVGSVSTDNSARIWDAATGKDLMVIRGHG